METETIPQHHARIKPKDAVTCVTEVRAVRMRSKTTPCKALLSKKGPPASKLGVVLQVSNADKFVAERLQYVLRLPNRKGCR